MNGEGQIASIYIISTYLYALYYGNTNDLSYYNFCFHLAGYKSFRALLRYTFEVGILKMIQFNIIQCEKEISISDMLCTIKL